MTFLGGVAAAVLALWVISPVVWPAAAPAAPAARGRGAACRNCGARPEADARFCSNCGASLGG